MFVQAGVLSYRFRPQVVHSARRVTAGSSHRKIQVQVETGGGDDSKLSFGLTGKIDGTRLSHLALLS